MPMYNFACVVDDGAMAVTHVIRGDDHVSNTPRQVLLYDAFGLERPVFAHIPMILGPDRERLSKRHGATSVDQYRGEGYVPDALVNFLSLLSWSSESGEELLPRDRLVREFDLDRVSRSAAVFDATKLDWMNGQYLRAMEAGALAALALPFFRAAGLPAESPAALESLLALLRDGIETLGRLPAKAEPFFREAVACENGEAEGVLRAAETRALAAAFLDATTALPEWNAEAFGAAMKTVSKATGLKGRALWMPARVMLLGQAHGPDLAKAAEVLGLEKCRRFAAAAAGAR
jgi:glutamyl/glutaminyl-tRNA synthetase